MDAIYISLPIISINKDEFLSIMKFTLNHNFVSGHHERSSNKIIFNLVIILFYFIQEKKLPYEFILLNIGLWKISYAENYDSLCTYQYTNTLCLKSEVCKSGRESVGSIW